MAPSFTPYTPTQAQKTALHEPVSFLMPVSNEAEVLESVIEEWVTNVIQYLPEGTELVFDEAASTDGTREILGRLGEKYPFIRVFYHEKKDGFANAARRLYQEARCPLVFFTDSDGQYVPAEFWKLVEFVEGHDIVHGAKVARQDPLFRKLASVFFNRIARVLFDMHYSDINSAFRIMKRDKVNQLLPQLHCMPTLLNAELLLRAELENYSIRQVRVRHRKRAFGESRGLPVRSFIRESFKAYQGLWALRKEYQL